MEKILERLKKLGLRGDEVADNLYWDAKDLDEDSFSLWVAQNDRKLRDVLRIEALMTDAGKNDKAFLKEYNDIRNSGLSIFKGDKKLAPSGKPMKTLDDFMSALGVTGSDNGEYVDDDRSAFTNPNNSAYWGNMSEEDRALAALSLGYESADEMGRDIERTGNAYQRQNQVEGWDANNELQPISWIVSALKGAAAPRIKEAQLAGRDITWQDVTGDMAELGLNFIPGVGLVRITGTGAKIVAKIPGVKNVANSAVANKVANAVANKVDNSLPGTLIGQGAPLVADQFAVPGLTQAIDAGLLYNPDMLGEETSGLNPRSEFDVGKMAAQAGAIAGAKGAVKGSAMVAKNMMEQGMGNEVGGGTFEKGVKMFESIGEKTDDLIKRRQAMLDRKAELAKKRENVTLPYDEDISTELASTDDLIDAENFRNLTKEAERLARSSEARRDYRKMNASDEASHEMVYNLFNYNDSHAHMSPERIKLAHNGNGMKSTNRIKTFLDYIEANEKGSDELFQMPDGRVVRRSLVGRNDINFPGADYTVFFDPSKSRNLMFKYGDMKSFPEEHALRLRTSTFPTEFGVPGVKESVSRNPAVLEQIQKDELLRRKLDPSKTAWKETSRDVIADAAFNALAREGVVGNVSDFDKKREDALWNRVMVKMRPLTANAALPIETRKKNADAILNVMQYGLDGLPAELYKKNPKVYKQIADNLGVKDWKHSSEENDVQPTTSYSSSF